jgi:hypothetical protein
LPKKGSLLYTAGRRESFQKVGNLKEGVRKKHLTAAEVEFRAGSMGLQAFEWVKKTRFSVTLLTRRHNNVFVNQSSLYLLTSSIE